MPPDAPQAKRADAMKHRTIIIPASAQRNAQALCKGSGRRSGDGMFVVGLSASGEAPATHYISSGTISARHGRAAAVQNP